MIDWQAIRALTASARARVQPFADLAQSLAEGGEEEEFHDRPGGMLTAPRPLPGAHSSEASPRPSGAISGAPRRVPGRTAHFQAAALGQTAPVVVAARAKRPTGERLF